MSVINHKVIEDVRGRLVSVEESRNIPFEIKRIFFIYDIPKGVSRGNHSHYKTLQYLIAVHGSCKVTLDNGKEKQTFFLNDPSKGLFQDALKWGVMHDFSSDCVLLVLASEYYEESDYIFDYDCFLKSVK